MTPTTIPMTNTHKEPARCGFKVRCPLCGSADDVQSIDLDDLQTLHCAGCSEDYTTEDIRELLAGWTRVLNWIDLAPTAKE